MFAGQQLLSDLVAPFVDIPTGPGKVIVDPHFRGPAEIIRD